MTAESSISDVSPRAAGVRAADETFEALFLLHRDTVLRYLRSFSPDDDEVLDLVAITFERALIALRGPGLPELPLPWLLRVARNAAIDRSRRGRTRHVVLGMLGRLPRQEAPGPETHVLGRESDDSFRRTLAQLPAAQRDVLALRYGADLSVREVAQTLGKSEASVHKLITRGLGRLREIEHDAH